MMTLVIPFLVVLAYNLICFVLVVVRLTRNAKLLSTNRKKMVTFYALLLLLIGVWRVPACLRFIEQASGQHWQPRFTTVLLVIFVPSEGLVKVIGFSLYFNLFKKFCTCGWRKESDGFADDFTKSANNPDSIGKSSIREPNEPENRKSFSYVSTDSNETSNSDMAVETKVGQSAA